MYFGIVGCVALQQLFPGASGNRWGRVVSLTGKRSVGPGRNPLPSRATPEKSHSRKGQPSAAPSYSLEWSDQRRMTSRPWLPDTASEFAAQSTVEGRYSRYQRIAKPAHSISLCYRDSHRLSSSEFDWKAFHKSCSRNSVRIAARNRKMIRFVSCDGEPLRELIDARIVQWHAHDGRMPRRIAFDRALPRILCRQK
jgi:hypothetical protein